MKKITFLLLFAVVACNSPEPPTTTTTTTTTEIDSSEDERYISVSNNHLVKGGKKELMKIATCFRAIYVSEDLALRSGRNLDPNRITDPRKLLPKMNWSNKTSNYWLKQFEKANDLKDDTFDTRCLVSKNIDTDTGVTSIDTSLIIAFFDKYENSDTLYLPISYISHLRKEK